MGERISYVPLLFAAVVNYIVSVVPSLYVCHNSHVPYAVGSTLILRIDWYLRLVQDHSYELSDLRSYNQSCSCSSSMFLKKDLESRSLIFAFSYSVSVFKARFLLPCYLNVALYWLISSSSLLLLI